VHVKKVFVRGRRDRIQCELCEKWFHTGCVKISEYTYKVLDKMTNLHWFCEPCNNGACKLLVNFSRQTREFVRLSRTKKLAKSCVLN